MISADTHLVDRFVESVVGRSIGRSVDATRRPLIAAKCLHLHAITQRWHRCRGIIKTSVPGIYIYIYIILDRSAYVCSVPSLCLQSKFHERGVMFNDVN